MHADYVLDYDVISTARAQNLYLMIRLNGGPPPAGSARVPLNMSVVLDKSGSMAGDKLDYVKKATQFLVQHLGSSDHFSLVTYDTTVKVEIPPEQVVMKDRITQIIDKIRAGSSTNLSGGWLEGCKLVAEKQADGQVNRVLLLSDGLANVGITDIERLKSMARQKRDEGVTTTTLGVGMRFNEQLLRDMANEGGGAFYFIDDPDQAPHIFHEELQDLLSVVGQNLVVTLTTSEDVKMMAQFNAYPTEEHGGAVAFRMGDLFAEELKILLLELSIPALAEMGEVEVARVRIDYDELTTNAALHRTHELPIIVNMVEENEYGVHKPNEEVMRSVLMLRAARAREDAVEHANKGDFEKARDIISKVADDIENSQMMDAVGDSQQQHDMLREEAVDYDLGPERFDDYTRISSSTKAMYFTDLRQSRQQESSKLHNRMKRSRVAQERGGDTPTLVTWRCESLKLTMDILTLGRADDNDIVIPDDEVSKHHAKITREGENLYLEDLNSTNGTYANGGKLMTRFRLSIGDVVTVGGWLFRFEGDKE